MDLSTTISELANAVTTIMSPFSSVEQRKLAHDACEDFKKTSPYCVQCGLRLCAEQNSPFVRHFGFQLIEHSIKFRWNDMKPDDKQFIKNNALEILSSGTKDILSEEAHIKAVLSRIIVEMIKREWPQQWPNMLQELNDICSLGPTQKELVLLVFLHFAEDLNNVPIAPARRKKDLYNALTSNLKALFTFFLSTLTQHYGQYIELLYYVNEFSSVLLKNLESPEKQAQAAVHRCVSVTTLKTLGGFLEWVQWSYVTGENNLLLRILCTLLSDSTLRIYAIECLLLLVCRKGKSEDRLPLLILFDKDAMGALFAAASSACEHILQDGGVHYSFLKSLCQVLVELGSQLAALWGVCEDVEQPVTFELYLNGIFTCTSHSSIVLNHKTMNLWNCFFQHPIISKNNLILQMIPEIVKIIGERLVMSGLPSKMNSPSCEFSLLDFDSDESFMFNYSKFRSQMVDVLRNAAHLLPELVFKVGAEVLLSLLTNASNAAGQSSDDFGFPVKLEAVATYLECVSRRLFFDDNIKLCKTQGIELLTILLRFNTEDPVTLQSFLSCMSATFFYLAEAPERVPAVLQKLFDAVIFTDAKDTELLKSHTTRSVRRHACACIFNVCKVHTKLLLSFFDEMYHHVKRLQQADQLGYMEQCLLQEALIILSNEFHSYETQSSFIKELLATIEEKWLKLTREMSSAVSLMAMLGLNKPPKPLTVMDDCAAHRLNIIECVHTMLAVVRRCRAPENREVAQNGGFCHSGSIRSPAGVHILPLLDGVFAFIRCMNGLHESAVWSQFHPEYNTVLEMYDSDKSMIIGMDIHSTSAAEVSNDTNSTLCQPKVKNIVHYLYESCTQVLMHAVQSFGMEFYTRHNLPTIINQNIFSSLGDMPDFKLRLLLQYNFLKPFIRSCPPSCYHVLVPVLQHLCPFMYQKLTSKWEKFKQKYGTSSGYEGEMTEMNEVFEDQLNRLLTREYIEIFDHALHQRNAHIEEEVDQMEAEAQNKLPSSQHEKLGNLGIFLLRAEIQADDKTYIMHYHDKNFGELRSIIICTLFNFLHWLDTLSSFKSIGLCLMVFRQLLADNAITKEEEVVYLLQNVFCGLKELGEHDQNQTSLLSLGLLIYDSMRPLFPNLQNMLLDTGCPPSDLKKFDSALLQKQTKHFPDKKRKDSFKGLVSKIIGKNVGQHFKNDIRIHNLPWLFKPERPKSSNIVDPSEDLDLP